MPWSHFLPTLFQVFYLCTWLPSIQPRCLLILPRPLSTHVDERIKEGSHRIGKKRLLSYDLVALTII